MFMLQKMHALAVGQAGAAGYTVNAVDFDGTNDYLSKATNIGAADSSTGILSFWMRIDGGNANNRFVLDNDRVQCVILPNGPAYFYIANSAASSDFVFQTSTNQAVSGTWVNILSSWNTNFGAASKIRHLYKNDASDVTTNSDTAAAFNANYNRSTWRVASNVANGLKFDGCIAEFYFAPGQFLDFSVEANRRKFISAAGKPVDLGVDGSTPTGTAPAIYLNDLAASFGTNKGSGGNFTITGTLDTASSSPSD